MISFFLFTRINFLVLFIQTNTCLIDGDLNADWMFLFNMHQATRRLIGLEPSLQLRSYEGSLLIQLFRESLSDKTLRDNAERYYGQWGFMVFDWGIRCFSDIERNITNKSIYAFSFLVGKDREPQFINANFFLPILPIGIVAYAWTLLWDNLCRNSCIQTTLISFQWYSPAWTFIPSLCQSNTENFNIYS